jgi:hypothetical protein
LYTLYASFGRRYPSSFFPFLPDTLVEIQPQNEKWLALNTTFEMNDSPTKSGRKSKYEGDEEDGVWQELREAEEIGWRGVWV